MLDVSFNPHIRTNNIYLLLNLKQNDFSFLKEMFLANHILL